MAYPLADPQTVQIIRQLAARPEEVVVTQRAECDLWDEHITKEDVCEAVCAWIDAGKDVEQITTSQVPEHKGDPAYVMMPEVEGKTRYVKVTILRRGEWKEALLLVSSHRPNR